MNTVKNDIFNGLQPEYCYIVEEIITFGGGRE